VQRKEKEQREEERKKKEKEKRGAMGGGNMGDAMAVRLAAMYGLSGVPGIPPTPTTPTPAYADSQKQAGVVEISGDAAGEESESSTTSAKEVVGSA